MEMCRRLLEVPDTRRFKGNALALCPLVLGSCWQVQPLCCGSCYLLLTPESNLLSLPAWGEDLWLSINPPHLQHQLGLARPTALQYEQLLSVLNLFSVKTAIIGLPALFV